MTAKKQTKFGDDSAQQNNNNTDTTSPSYKPILPYLQLLKNKNIDTSYAEILDVFK